MPTSNILLSGNIHYLEIFEHLRSEMGAKNVEFGHWVSDDAFEIPVRDEDGIIVVTVQCQPTAFIDVLAGDRTLVTLVSAPDVSWRDRHEVVAWAISVPYDGLLDLDGHGGDYSRDWQAFEANGNRPILSAADHLEVELAKLVGAPAASLISPNKAAVHDLLQTYEAEVRLFDKLKLKSLNVPELIETDPDDDLKATWHFESPMPHDKAKAELVYSWGERTFVARIQHHWTAATVEIRKATQREIELLVDLLPEEHQEKIAEWKHDYMREVGPLLAAAN